MKETKECKKKKKKKKRKLCSMLWINSLHPQPLTTQPSFHAYRPILQIIKLSPREDAQPPKVIPSSIDALNIQSQSTIQILRIHSRPGSLLYLEALGNIHRWRKVKTVSHKNRGVVSCLMHVTKEHTEHHSSCNKTMSLDYSWIAQLKDLFKK